MYIATQQSLSDIIQENLINGRLSIRAVARLLEVSSHQKIILDGTFASQKLGQILTEQGFEAGTLLENDYDLDLGESPNILGKRLLTGTLTQMNKIARFMDENWLW